MAVFFVHPLVHFIQSILTEFSISIHSNLPSMKKKGVDRYRKTFFWRIIENFAYDSNIFRGGGPLLRLCELADNRVPHNSIFWHFLTIKFTMQVMKL